MLHLPSEKVFPEEIPYKRRHRDIKKVKNCYEEEKFTTKDELYSEFYDNPYNDINKRIKNESDQVKRHKQEKYWNPSDDEFENEFSEERDRRNLKFKLPG